VPSTPWVNPGNYTVKLTVDGKSYTQPITVKQDPRVKTAAMVMQAIYADTKAAYYGAIDAQTAAAQAQGLRTQIAAITPKPSGAVGDAIAAFDKKVQDLIGAAPGGGGGGRGGGAGRGGGGLGSGVAAGATVSLPNRGAGAAAPTAAPQPAPAAVQPPAAPTSTLGAASAALSGVMNSFQGADVAPTANQLAAMAAAKKTAADAMAKWNTVKTIDLAAINLKLKTAGLGPLKIQ
jgi:PKD repeat protein